MHGFQQSRWRIVNSATGFLAIVILSISVVGPARAGGPVSLPNSATTINEDYTIFWNPNPASSNYMPSSKAINAALALDRDGDSSPGNPLGYHDGYANALFAYPFFSDQPKSVYFYDCKDLDPGCDNGQATVGDIRMPVSIYANKSDSCIMNVVGHELFHHVEFAYAEFLGGSGASAVWGKTAAEGQARALQDKIYTIFDLFPTASCVGGFLGQVNGYLANTNQYLWTSSYDAALWWTYLMEQYGLTQGEPRLGIDFLTSWWGRAVAAGLAGNDALLITDATIKLYEPSDNIFNAFRHFAIANLVKDLDLSNSSDAFINRYSYRDEDPAGGFNLMDYNNVKIEFKPDPLLPGADINQLMGVQYFGSRYLRADISQCPANRIIRVEIDAADNAPSGVSNLAGYGVVITRNKQPKQFYKKFDVDWTLTTFQSTNPYDKLYLVVAPVAGFWVGNVTISCTPPETTFDVDFPISGAGNPTHGGPPGSLATAVVEVAPIFDKLRDQPLISGLPAGVFQATVGGLPATTLGATRSENGYQILLGLPPQQTPGVHDLAFQVGDTLFTDAGSVVYQDDPLPDVILAVDTSTTMLEPADGSRLDAVRQGVPHFFDLLPGAGKIGLIDFSGNDVEPDDDAVTAAPLAEVDAMHLDRLKIAAAALSSGAGRYTSIGDAAQLAHSMFLADGTPLRAQHLVLISDGSENEGLFWSEVRDQIKMAGIRVHTVAFGPLADQPLLYAIARETGGEYRYADAEPPASDVLDLYAALAQIADVISDRTQLSHDSVRVPANSTVMIDVPVQIDLLPPLVASVGSTAARASDSPIASVRLFRPDGSEVLDGVSGAVVQDNESNLAFVVQPARGTWRFEISGNAMANNTQVDVSLSAKPDHGLRVVANAFRPDPGDGTFTSFEHGQPVGVSAAVVDNNGPVSLASQVAEVQRPGGGPHVRVFSGQSFVPNDPADSIFFPDPDCEPGCKGVNFTLNFEKVTTEYNPNQGAPTGFADNGVGPGARGSYPIRVRTTLESGQQLISHLAVAVVQESVFPDRDSDTLPDRYEDRHDCLDGDLDDATLDADADGLNNRAEFDQGSHPCDPDSDRGGESDGSEVRGGRNPLHPEDDALGRPLDAYVVNERSEHEEYSLPLTANANTIRLPGRVKYTNITLKRGVINSALAPLVTLDLSTYSEPVYVDQSVVIGQEYFYQWVGMDDDGNESAPGHVFSGFALADPNAPLGAVLVNDGAARTDDPLLVIENSLYNKNLATAEYRGTLDDEDPGAWLPYVGQWTLAAPPVLTPTIRTVGVVLRDAAGLESTTYFDDIEQWPAGSLGDVQGSVELLGGPADRSGVLVEILGDETEQPTLTDAAGNFLLPDLMPGSYTLMFSRYQHQTASVANVQIVAGETVVLGPVSLLADSEVLFSDGFESGVP